MRNIMLVIVACGCGSSPPPKSAPPPATAKPPTTAPCDLGQFSELGRVVDAMAPGEVHAFNVTFATKPSPGARLVLPPELESSLTVFSDNEAQGSLTKDQVLALCKRADVTDVKPQGPVQLNAK